jgi:hypothetical protein
MKVIYQPHAYHELLGSKRYKASKLVRNLAKKSCMCDTKFEKTSQSVTAPHQEVGYDAHQARKDLARCLGIRHMYLFQLPNVADVLLNRSV